MAMNELRAGARVSGTDGELGTVEALVIDPTAGCITHLVVGRDHLRRRHLVTVDRVRSSSPAGVALDLDAAALDRCEPFDERRHGHVQVS
jgi:sporulation protein YlmC with PRC-barrel domain